MGKASVSSVRYVKIMQQLNIKILSFLLSIALIILRKGSARPHGNIREKTILLTGTFHSLNWINAHIVPISKSNECSRLILIGNDFVDGVSNIELLAPPSWARKLFGKVPSRLITFAYYSYKIRPEYVGGFHLLFNGIAAALCATIFRTKSLYFCVGGPAEILGGGIQSENKILKNLREPDFKIETKLKAITRYFDTIVTMGTSAKEYFDNECGCKNVYVNSGGINNAIFYPAKVDKIYDFVIAGRLEEIKRIDIYIDAISILCEAGLKVNAVIVGSGTLADKLKSHVEELKLSNSISFVGAQSKMHDWYNSAKAFVLTSDSEGLSLALIEAMMCGIPAIVSDVGDLSNIVKDGENGFLIDPREPKYFASKMKHILECYGSEVYSMLCKNALKSSLVFEVSSAVKKWDKILAQDTNVLSIKSK